MPRPSPYPCSEKQRLGNRKGLDFRNIESYVHPSFGWFLQRLRRHVVNSQESEDNLLLNTPTSTNMSIEHVARSIPFEKASSILPCRPILLDLWYVSASLFVSWSRQSLNLSFPECRFYDRTCALMRFIDNNVRVHA